MDLDKPILHQIGFEVLLAPVNLLTGANTGTFVSMKNFDRASIFLVKTAGTAGEDPVVTFRQATAVAGTGAKNLATVTRWARRQHPTALPNEWTFLTQAAGATITDADGAEAIAIWQVEIHAEDLDRANGFDCISVSIADPGVGTAQTACVIAILTNPRYSTPLPLSSRVD